MHQSHRMYFVALTLLWAGLLFSTPSHSATLQPGLWFDPEHAGNGIEWRQNGDRLTAIIYTFDTQQQPVWYLANGELNADGSAELTAYQYHWSAGAEAPDRSALPTPLSVQIEHSRSLTLNYRFGQSEGQWEMQPLVMSHLINEVDRSALWYDEQQPGWGYSLFEQGPHRAVALYLYDEQGKPTWRFGQGSTSMDRLTLKRFQGCANCAGASSVSSGHIQLAFGDDPGIELRLDDAGALWQSLDTRVTALTLRGDQMPHVAALLPSDSLEQLERHLKAGFAQRSGFQPIPDADFSPRPPGGGNASQPFSTTNVQVTGVDESDRVKAVGNYLYALNLSEDSYDLELHSYKVLDDGSPPIALERISLPESVDSFEALDSTLYAFNSQLIVVHQFAPDLYYNDICPSPWTDADQWLNGRTDIIRYRIADNGSLNLIEHLQFDGFLVNDRRIGERLFLTLRYVPDIEYFIRNASDEQDIAFNQSLLDSTTLDDLLPAVRRNDGPSTRLLDINNTYLPPGADRLATADLLTVVDLHIPPDEPGEMNTLTLAGTSDGLYASQQGIYLFTRQFHAVTLPEGGGFEDFYTDTTEVHQIDFTPDGLVYRGSGRVDGNLDTFGDVSQWRFGQVDDALAVVTRLMPYQTGDEGQNRLTLLSPSERRPGLLRQRSQIPNEARPAPLGKPGERVHGVRFVGSRAYVSTFEQIDPFYVIDLSNPDDPVVRGELEVPGTTDYLHVVGENTVLALGYHIELVPQAGSIATVRDGIQALLIDTADPASPQLLDRIQLGGAGTDSEAIDDHLAVAWLPASDDQPARLAIPVRLHEREENASPGTYQPWSSDGVAVFSIATDSGQAHMDLRYFASHRAGESPAPIDYRRRVILGTETLLFSDLEGLWHAPLALDTDMSGPY